MPHVSEDVRHLGVVLDVIGTTNHQHAPPELHTVVQLVNLIRDGTPARAVGDSTVEVSAEQMVPSTTVWLTGSTCGPVGPVKPTRPRRTEESSRMHSTGSSDSVLFHRVVTEPLQRRHGCWHGVATDTAGQVRV